MEVPGASAASGQAEVRQCRHPYPCTGRRTCLTDIRCVQRCCTTAVLVPPALQVFVLQQLEYKQVMLLECLRRAMLSVQLSDKPLPRALWRSTRNVSSPGCFADAFCLCSVAEFAKFAESAS